MIKQLGIQGKVIDIDTENLTKETLNDALVKIGVLISDEALEFLVSKLKEEEE
ncbi:MAG: hypothetical protein NC346_09045 [Prevotella sp.]|nr:hypothetical protein [Prevotella sp.]MCM1443668.1 hypothetical protein [Muribaculum sp.]MCM1577149.1 hypothetical protein [Bacteroides sp.]